MEDTLIFSSRQPQAVSQRLERVIEWLILALVFLFPFQKRYSHFLKSFSYSLAPDHVDLPSFFSRKLDFYGSDILILFTTGLCLYRFRNRLRAFFLEGPSSYLMGYIAVALLSIAFSITAGYALQYYRLLQFFLFFLLFCSLSHFLQSVQRGNLLRKILWALLAAGVIECGIGITQYFLQHSLGLKSVGEVNIQNFCFPMEGGRRWIGDHLPGFFSGNTSLCRCSGTFTHPNVLGGFLFGTLFLTYYLCVSEEKSKVRLFLYTLIPLQVFTLCITFSRSALIATALSSCVWGTLWLFDRKHVSSVLVRRRVRVMCTVLLSAAGCLLLFYDQFFARGGIVNYNQVTAGADTERIVYQNIAWKIFKDHPVLGGGYNNFQILSAEYTPEDSTTVLFAKVHNIYLLTLAETGLLGTAFFLLFLFSTCRRAIAKLTDGHELTNILLCIFLGYLFIGLCDYYLLHTQHGKTMFILFSCLLYVQSRSLVFQRG